MTTPRLPEERKYSHGLDDRAQSPGSGVETKGFGASSISEMSSLPTPSSTNGAGSLVPSDEKKQTQVLATSSLVSQVGVLTPEEQEWKNAYYNNAVKAINNNDLDHLALILGPEFYFSWAEYSRQMHETQMPRLSLFYSYALNFIELYEEKLEKDEQHKEYERRVNNEICLRMGSGGRESLTPASLREELKQNEVCATYEKALEDYKGPGGIAAYFKTIEPIKDRLSIASFPVPKDMLLPEEGKPFQSQLFTYLKLSNEQSLNTLRNNLQCEAQTLTQTKNRVMNESGYQRRYVDRTSMKYDELATKFLEKFKITYNENFISITQFSALKKKIKEAQEMRLVVEKEEEKFHQMENDSESLLSARVRNKHGQVQTRSKEDYLKAATQNYMDRVAEIDESVVTDNYKQNAADYHAGIEPKRSFVNRMIDLRSKMGLDVFDRMVDERGRTLLYHALYVYKGCDDRERKRRIALNNLLLKQGCSPYPYPYAISEHTVEKEIHNTAFKYANSQETKESGEDRNLPDWPLLRSIFRFNLLTLSPAADILRASLVRYAGNKEELYRLGISSDTHGLLVSIGYIITGWFQDERITKRRMADVVELLEALYQSALFGTDKVVIDKVNSIWGKIKTTSALTGRRGKSELRDIFDSHIKLVGTDEQEGQVIKLLNEPAVSPGYLKIANLKDLINEESAKIIKKLEEELTAKEAARQAEFEKMKKQQEEKERSLKVKMEQEVALQRQEAASQKAEMEQKLAEERQLRVKKESEMSQELAQTKQMIAQLFQLMQSHQRGSSVTSAEIASIQSAAALSPAVELKEPSTASSTASLVTDPISKPLPDILQYLDDWRAEARGAASSASSSASVVACGFYSNGLQSNVTLGAGAGAMPKLAGSSSLKST